ncbi:MAG: hypothetical protein E5X96_09930, partial [Mesorhizobium sp.]
MLDASRRNLARPLQMHPQQPRGCEGQLPREVELLDRGRTEDIMQTAIAAAEPRGKVPFYRHLYVQV